MDIYLASDGGIVQIPHALGDYDSLEGVYADVSAVTGVVAGNVLLFTDDGRELKQEVLEELWERGGGGGAGASSPHRTAVYLFNRETFFSEPERWADEMREDTILPPPLALSTMLDLSHAQAPFAVAYDHLQHLQSLFKAQAHALQIAYANLAYHLQPIVDAFRDFTDRADAQLDAHDKLLAGYEVDMAMLPKVVVHESLFRRRDKDKDGEDKRKTLVDWIHAKKMEQVRDWCQSAHADYVNRYNNVANEMDELALQSDAERQQAEHRILGVEREFQEALGRIELASQQIEALMQSDEIDWEQHLLELDGAMREDLASMTQIKNDFTLDLHVHLRQIAGFQVRITKFTRPMTELDLDLRQKNAFPHLERLHNLPFAYAANVVEIVHRKEFAGVLVEWAARVAKAVNDYLATEVKRRQAHKAGNQLPWEIEPLEKSQTPHLDVTVAGGVDALEAVGLGRDDVDDILKWVDSLQSDTDLQKEGVENPVPPLRAQVEALLQALDGVTGSLGEALQHAVTASSQATAESIDRLRATNAEHEQRIADMEQAHADQVRELEAKHEHRTNTFQARQGELQEELVRLRGDVGDEMLVRQQLSNELEEKTRENEERARELDEQTELLSGLQADLAQEKDHAADLGGRLQEALLDVDGLRSAEQSLINQLREMQEERTRILTDLGEAQLLAQNYESELAGTKAELESTAAQLVVAQKSRDQALKTQSAESERQMRDHIAEADGDRAVLEHQNLTLTKELEDIKTEMSEKLSTARNASIRREDGLKAELSFTKAQLREVQRKETVMADELAMAKDASTALVKKEKHQAELAKDAVTLAGKYHEACQRLMTAIAASTTISSSVQLPNRPKTPPAANSAHGSLNESNVLVRSLETANGFDVDAFADAVLKTINLARKLSKSCKHYREMARDKITISNFRSGDLVLFLPTRNAAVKAWAAFNISAPHHFLNVTEPISKSLQGKDYYLARIVGTDEAVVHGDSPKTNPYGLAEGLRYYSHRVEEWTPGTTRAMRRSSMAAAETGGSSPLSPIAVRSRAKSSYFPERPASAGPGSRVTSGAGIAPSPSPPARLSPPEGGTPQRRSATPSDNMSTDRPSATVSPAPQVEAKTAEKITSVFRPVMVTTNVSRGNSTPPVPQNSTTLTASLGSPGTPSPASRSTSPTTTTNVMTSPTVSSPTAMTFSTVGMATTPLASSPSGMPVPTRGQRRSHRSSLASTASPPPRDGAVFAPSSLGRPASVASSTGSHAASRGLPIPSAATGKSAPAPAVATSAEGSSTPSSFGDVGPGRRVMKKPSTTSLKGGSGKAVEPSPLGTNDPLAGSMSGSTTLPGSHREGFLSGLSLSRRKASTAKEKENTAADILRKFGGS